MLLCQRLSPQGTRAISAPLGTALRDNIIDIALVTAIYLVPRGNSNLCLWNPNPIRARLLWLQVSPN